VLLFMPATRDATGRDPANRQFQPVACTIDGALVTSVRCADLVPARAEIRLLDHTTLTVKRATTFVHADDFPMDDFPSPYAPACCNYKGCDGKTIQYDVVRGKKAKPLDDGALVAVWPPDADAGIVPVTSEDNERFTHNRRSLGTYQVLAKLLVTFDLDHDGHPEHLLYLPESNDYGLEVVTDDPKAPPLSRFDCGSV
jgi:hypothetical protein